MRIVARVRSESLHSSSIFLSTGYLSSSSSLMSAGDSEKKAISEPEANPDTKSRNAAITTATSAPAVGMMRCTCIKLSCSSVIIDFPCL